MSVDPESVDHHPLVASRALLAGKVRPLPSRLGTRAPTGGLSRGTLDTLMAIADALFSTDAGSPPVERTEWLRGELGDFMARGTFTGRALFTLAALVISIVAPLRIGALPPFRRLSLAQRVHALQLFEVSRLSALLIAVRALMCLIYYEHPDAALGLGLALEGPAVGTLYTPKRTE